MNLTNIRIAKLGKDITIAFDFDNTWRRSVVIREGIDAQELEFYLTMVAREMVHDEQGLAGSMVAQVAPVVTPSMVWVPLEPDDGSQVMVFE